jgi:hypothetical protein
MAARAEALAWVSILGLFRGICGCVSHERAGAIARLNVDIVFVVDLDVDGDVDLGETL